MIPTISAIVRPESEPLPSDGLILLIVVGVTAPVVEGESVLPFDNFGEGLFAGDKFAKGEGVLEVGGGEDGTGVDVGKMMLV